MQINTTTPAPAATNGNNQDNTDNAEEEDDDLGNEALQYLSTCLQIIEDFVKSDEKVPEADREKRQKTILYVQIDALNRRAELSQFIGDLQFAIEDFTKVVDLCKKYPEKNERLLASALYNIGKSQLILQKNSEANESFKESMKALRANLFKLTKKEDKDEEVTELIKPSIFDDDEIKVIKQFLVEVQEHIKDIKDIEAQKEILAKEMPKKTEEVCPVPEGFGKPMQST